MVERTKANTGLTSLVDASTKMVALARTAEGRRTTIFEEREAKVGLPAHRNQLIRQLGTVLVLAGIMRVVTGCDGLS